MRIKLKLMGMLRNNAAQGTNNSMDVDGSMTVAGLLDQLGLRDEQVHLVMRNGSQVNDLHEALQEYDEITLFPPVSGG